ncbi:MAG: 8-oxo-dGTP diphosphatase [Frankiaceae bacterium]|nr:8-oxo-dGTP diphosphatase [Frankiaceae bacterium]
MIVVVAAAIVDPGPLPRILAAQRDYPAALAGRWELPGGKVEPGEDEVAALVRECREELGVAVDVLDRVGADLGGAEAEFTLRVWWARIAAGQPEPREHRELRWLAAGELDDVDWLPTNRPLVPVLRAHLVDWRG